MRAVLFTLLGIVLTASLSYFSGLDLGRLKTSAEVRSNAYIAFMRAQVRWDFQQEPEKYALETAEARKQIAVYGSRGVVEALAHYWRRPEFARPSCGGTQEQQKDDVKIYQHMRNDIVWWFERVKDDDMMMLIFLCKSAL